MENLPCSLLIGTDFLCKSPLWLNFQKLLIWNPGSPRNEWGRLCLFSGVSGSSDIAPRNSRDVVCDRAVLPPEPDTGQSKGLDLEQIIFSMSLKYSLDDDTETEEMWVPNSTTFDHNWPLEEPEDDPWSTLKISDTLTTEQKTQLLGRMKIYPECFPSRD